MKYFLGSILTNENGVKSEVYALFVAMNQEAAARALNLRTSLFAGDGGVDVGRGFWQFREKNILCTAGVLKEISPVGFKDLELVYPVVRVTDAPSLEEEEPSEMVKTLAHRIGNQLTKMESPVPHGKMLKAVAASVGETDWATVLHKKAPQPKQPVRPGPQLPKGVSVTAIELGAGPYAEYWSVEGYVGKTLVLSMNNHVQKNWRVSSSLAWMADLEEAPLYAACVAEVVRKAKELESSAAS